MVGGSEIELGGQPPGFLYLIIPPYCRGHLSQAGLYHPCSFFLGREAIAPLCWKTSWPILWTLQLAMIYTRKLIKRLMTISLQAECFHSGCFQAFPDLLLDTDLGKTNLGVYHGPPAARTTSCRLQIAPNRILGASHK